MRCPQCNSKRIQRDIENASALARLAGMRKLVCNQCGHVFQGFDPLNKLGRKETNPDADGANRRRSARFRVHFPTTISLVPGTGKEATSSYSGSVQGHCESINEHGVGLSLVGSRFSDEDMQRVGQRVLMRIRLPEMTLEAVGSIVNSSRLGESQKRKWLLGVKFQRMSEDDKISLSNYLEARAQTEPLLTS